MMTLIGMFAFMLIPVWIPIIAVSIGYVGDLFRRPSPSRVRTVELAANLAAACHGSVSPAPPVTVARAKSISG